MRRYNFDEIIERRHTNAMNTDGFRSYIFHAGPEKTFSYKDEEFIRMWVADMEFAVAPEICDAIKARIDKRIFGYSMVFDPAYYEALQNWCRERYDWTFPKEELTFSPGIIPALYQLVEILLTAHEKMMVLTPSYGFFKHAATYNNVELVTSELKNQDGYFTIDFEDLEKKASDPMMKLLVWCNPHNPTGRTWSWEEQEKVAAIAEKYNLWIISDEIHCDILRKGAQHIPLGKVMPDYPKLITCMSASKTFNIAGLMFSNIIIRHAEVREAFGARDKTVGFVNPLSISAHQAAYEAGGAWLSELTEYLDGNFDFLEAFLKESLPEAVYKRPEATYLAWIDMKAYLPDVADLADFFANEAGVLLEGGNDLFVGNAEGYIRLNLAMPRCMVETGMNRIKEAVIRRSSRHVIK